MTPGDDAYERLVTRLRDLAHSVRAVRMLRPDQQDVYDDRLLARVPSLAYTVPVNIRAHLSRAKQLALFTADAGEACSVCGKRVPSFHISGLTDRFEVLASVVLCPLHALRALAYNTLHTLLQQWADGTRTEWSVLENCRVRIALAALCAVSDTGTSEST